jgi:uncharacterized protein (TIGR00369 family)
MDKEKYAVIRRIIESIPFHVWLGVHVPELADGLAVLSLPFRPELVGDSRRPALHGGVLSTLADAAGGTAVWTRCGAHDRLATIDLRVDYLRPAPAEDLCATGTVRLIGNRVGNAVVRITPAADPDLILVEARGVYNIRKTRE